MCRPRAEGGLQLVHFPSWNKVCLLKLLWAVASKADKLWIRWLNAYYVKSQDVMTMAPPSDASYLFKKMLGCRSVVAGTAEWRDQHISGKFEAAPIYKLIRPLVAKVQWSDLVLNTIATLRAKFILWLALWNRLATKDRLL